MFSNLTNKFPWFQTHSSRDDNGERRFYALDLSEAGSKRLRWAFTAPLVQLNALVGALNVPIILGQIHAKNIFGINSAHPYSRLLQQLGWSALPPIVVTAIFYAALHAFGRVRKDALLETTKHYPIELAPTMEVRDFYLGIGLGAAAPAVLGAIGYSGSIFEVLRDPSIKNLFEAAATYLPILHGVSLASFCLYISHKLNSHKWSIRSTPGGVNKPTGPPDAEGGMIAEGGLARVPHGRSKVVACVCGD